MAVTALAHIDLGVVEEVVGERAFQRGLKYAQDKRVLRLEWDDDEDRLVGLVVGNGDAYQTEAFFIADHAGGFELLEGECSCPVELNCKHVAALVLTAAGAQAGSPDRVPARSAHSTRSARSAHPGTTASPVPRPPRPEPAPPAWEESFLPLLDPQGRARLRRDAAPLAIELSLDLGSTSRNFVSRWLSARIVRPGRRGWVNGGLRWGSLGSWQVTSDDHDPDHLLVLRALRALHGDGGGSVHRSYYGGADRDLDFATFDHMLWPLLDEAREVGLRLLHARHDLGEVDTSRRAELCFDVTRADDADGADVVVTPTLRVEGIDAEVVPVGFLGATGHGVVYTERCDVEATPDPSGWHLGLARMTRPASVPLQQMARSGRQVRIPAAEQDRFASDMWPRLRHIGAVVSSDGSFVEPAIAGPRLVIHARYGPGHTVDVGGEWAYEIAGAERRARPEADPADGGYRDPEAERDLIASLDGDLEGLGLVTRDGPRSHVHLTGLDTVRFATEVLPLLADDPRVVVEVTGHPADFREVSDSLVIGLSTEAVAGETDWFDLGVTLTVDGRQMPFAGVFRALASGETHLLLDDGAYFSLEKPELQALRRLIDEARSLQDQPPDGLRISRYQVGFWDELCQLGVVDRQAAAWERQVSGLRAITSLEPADVPAALTAQLRPYQRDGFGWLSFLWRHRLGGILADDMGLGKTLQTLALISHARELDPSLPPFLIVAPTSVVPNWVAEAARFAPELSVVAVTGTFGRSGCSVEQVIGGADVVVTTYTLLRLDAEAYHRAEWAGLVLDEAQNAKNHRSKVYGCIRRLPAPFKLAITGTPMENNLMELWSLLSIVAPGLFPDPARFGEHYARPIERHGDVELLTRLRGRIRPLVKRRTKDQVAADLPAKQEQVLDVELSPKHRSIYQTRLQRERQKVLGLIGDFDSNRFTILRSITLLRQLSLHPSLVEDSPAAAKVPCAKLDTLVQQMDEVIAGGHRALIFSQFTGFLGLVRERLDREGVDHCYLDGRTRNREAVLRRFKDGNAPAFLISLKAGGFGLNLTEADYCFLLDPWWNPATEAQAVDRTHRIGQTRNVIVYRMIASDTIEEKVMALKKRKAELFAGVMDEGELFSNRLDADDVRQLFD